MCHNYIGQTCVQHMCVDMCHNYIWHNYICHNYVGQTCVQPMCVDMCVAMRVDIVCSRTAGTL